jgi:hypothetical protein
VRFSLARLVSCPRRSTILFLGLLAIGATRVERAAAESPPTPPPTSEDIQRKREEEERERLKYEAEKARVDRINERVRQYKELMARIPFEPVPNTSNMVQVFMNGQDIHDIANKIYSVSDDASDAGFRSSYWPMVLFLNRAKDYDTGLPQYGRLDPQTPENNVALFPNVRKVGFKAVVAQIENADSSMALQMTAPVVLAYRKRLTEQVANLTSRAGDVPEATGPASMPGDLTVALFQGMQAEPKDTYPPRRLQQPAALTSTDPVSVDRPAPLEPMPPAWSLRQGVNMLGPTYEGYNLQYKPDHFDMAPEFAPMAFMGGRDPQGNPRTQPGMHFGLNQRFFKFLLVNESAFVAFSAGDAPGVNGISANAGLDFNLSMFNLAGLVGVTGLNVIGDFEAGPNLTAKIKVPVGQHVQILGMGLFTNIKHLRIETTDAEGNVSGGQTGVVNASYMGVGVLLR